MCQQEGVVGVMLPCSSKTNWSFLWQCKRPDSEWNNLDKNNLLVFCIILLLVAILFRRVISSNGYISFHLSLSNIFNLHLTSSEVAADLAFFLWMRNYEILIQKRRWAKLTKVSQQCPNENIFTLYPFACRRNYCGLDQLFAMEVDQHKHIFFATMHGILIKYT